MTFTTPRACCTCCFADQCGPGLQAGLLLWPCPERMAAWRRVRGFVFVTNERPVCLHYYGNYSSNDINNNKDIILTVTTPAVAETEEG